MAEYPNTKSIFDAESGKGQTRTGLSTQIVIMVEGQPVGAVQSFQITQQRGTKKISEVGTDGIIEIVPSTAATVSLSVSRIVFDGLSITEAFSRGFQNVMSQRIPFDIVVIDKFGGAEETSWITTTFRNCWFTNISKSYTSSEYVISENCSLDVEQIFTTKNNEAVGGFGHGIRDTRPQIDNAGIEQEADSGVRKGGMDAAGIVNAQYAD